MNGASISNNEEVEYALALYAELIRIDPSVGKNIGIIAPYSEQRRLLQKRFNNLYGRYVDIEISTVDGFQGREKDIIIFTCVRSEQQSRANGNASGKYEIS